MISLYYPLISCLLSSHVRVLDLGEFQGAKLSIVFSQGINILSRDIYHQQAPVNKLYVVKIAKFVDFQVILTEDKTFLETDYFCQL